MLLQQAKHLLRVLALDLGQHLAGLHRVQEVRVVHGAEKPLPAIKRLKVIDLQAEQVLEKFCDSRRRAQVNVDQRARTRLRHAKEGGLARWRRVKLAHGEVQPAEHVAWTSPARSDAKR